MVRAHVIADLGYGDAGKGTLSEYLTRRDGARLIIRHNGGGQAGHNIVLPDGRQHTFSQFGSGTFVEGVETYLSRFCQVDPPAILREADHLIKLGVSDPCSRLAIHPQAPLVTPYHKAQNRLRELARGPNRHGSCGTGAGEAVRDSIERPTECLRVGDMSTPGFQDRATEVREQKMAWLRMQPLIPMSPDPDVEDALSLLVDPSITKSFLGACREIVRCCSNGALDIPNGSCVIFEGSQGILIDQDYGFHPHTTWSRTTAANALTLLAEIPHPIEMVKWGVIRGYMVRHGPGPFPTEDPAFHPKETHNTTGRWQGPMRFGWLDIPLLRYAIEANGGLDAVALTCLDCLAGRDAKLCESYEPPHDQPLPLPVSRGEQAALGAKLQGVRPVYTPIELGSLPEVLGRLLGTRISITSHGPTHLDKREETAHDIH